MSTGTVNAANNNLDATVRIFDQFYRYEVNVPAAEYDIVYSFFRSTMDAKVAGNMTSALFQVSSDTKVPVLELLDTMKGQSGLDLTVSMAYYLNTIRSRATLLGVNAQVVPNYYAARLIIQ